MKAVCSTRSLETMATISDCVVDIRRRHLPYHDSHFAIDVRIAISPPGGILCRVDYRSELAFGV
jgi:hypothetical protein